MFKAVTSVVRGCVLLNSRTALENLLARRENLLNEFNQISGN